MSDEKPVEADRERLVVAIWDATTSMYYGIEGWHERAVTAEADNRALRAALAWYADAAHYENPKYGGLKDIEADGGKIAREALAKGGV